jgi:Amt family ammonium transporter
MEKTDRLSSGRWWFARCVVVVATLGRAATGYAEDAVKIDSGDTAWMLTSSALVLMMTAPGLALFYGGLVRSKNVLNLLMQSFILVALISMMMEQRAALGAKAME